MATTTINDTHLEIAAALADLIPTAKPLVAAPHGGAPIGPQATQAVMASFVGDTSADMALALIDSASLEAASEAGAVDVSDLLRPALEAAGEQLAVGVLGQVRLGDATDLFEDKDSSVFELSVAGGPTAGWFVVRTRKKIKVSDDSVSSAKLSRISNVDMSLAVEVGRTKMPVRDVLNLEPGAIVELDRSAGGPADVLLNGRVIAKGEVVVVDGGDYGVRITKILDADD